MKVALNWLKELVDLKVTVEELAELLGKKTVAVKELTKESMELDMKGYNRADLLSLRGVASEIGAVTNSKTLFTQLAEADYYWVGKNIDDAKFEVYDTGLCPLYTLTKIEGLKAAPSKPEWVEKLAASGIRSINNITDITNLIMLEFGQPMHAFDLTKISGEKIVIRRAKCQEKIETLDKKVRSLNEEDLVIADTQKAVGIAGVMGGLNSEISDATTEILLEAAIFDPVNTRKSAARLGLQSEASKRFYHGLTKKRLFQALDFAIRMYLQLGGKVTALKIEGDTQDQLKKIPLSLKKVNRLSGIEFDQTDIEKYLKALNFEMEFNANAEGEPAWVVTPPFYRLDISLEEDLVEEVARMHGYEKIPSIPLAQIAQAQVNQRLFELISNFKTHLVEAGLTEVQTYSFFSTSVLNSLGGDIEDKSKHLVNISNPISAETEYLRENIWANLLESAGKNIRHGIKDIAIFETGKIFYKTGGKNEEKYSLAGLLINGTDNPITELYQIFNKINSELDLKIVFGDSKPQVKTANLFHPNRFKSIHYKNEQVGWIAEVHPRLARSFGIEKRVAVFELFIEKLI